MHALYKFCVDHEVKVILSCKLNNGCISGERAATDQANMQDKQWLSLTPLLLSWCTTFIVCACCCVADSDETPLFSDWERTRPTTLSSPVHAEESALLTLYAWLSALTSWLIVSSFWMKISMEQISSLKWVQFPQNFLFQSLCLLEGRGRECKK